MEYFVITTCDSNSPMRRQSFFNNSSRIRSTTFSVRHDVVNLSSDKKCTLNSIAKLRNLPRGWKHKWLSWAFSRFATAVLAENIGGQDPALAPDSQGNRLN